MLEDVIIYSTAGAIGFIHGFVRGDAPLYKRVARDSEKELAVKIIEIPTALTLFSLSHFLVPKFIESSQNPSIYEGAGKGVLSLIF